MSFAQYDYFNIATIHDYHNYKEGAYFQQRTTVAGKRASCCAGCYFEWALTEAKVAITFDDDPSDETMALLGELAQLGVHATFCMIGTQMARFPAAVKAIVAAGDDLCDHSQTHPHLPQLSLASPANFVQELLKPAQTMYTLTGQWPAFLRPPYGDDSSKTGQNVLEGPAALDGMHELRWNVDGRDWDNHSAVIACARIIHGAVGTYPTPAAKAGSIVLMHDQSSGMVPTLQEAQCVITGLRVEGLQPVSVSELLAS